MWSTSSNVNDWHFFAGRGSQIQEGEIFPQHLLSHCDSNKIRGFTLESLTKFQGGRGRECIRNIRWKDNFWNLVTKMDQSKKWKIKVKKIIIQNKIIF